MRKEPDIGAVETAPAEPYLKRESPHPLFAGKPGSSWEAAAFNPCVLNDDSGLIRMVYRGTANDGSRFKPGEYISSVGYAESRDGMYFTRSLQPLLKPDRLYENAMGCEDATIQKINGTYFMHYTAVGGLGDRKPDVRIALAVSRDFRSWEKQGIVGPGERSKSAVLFPEEINGQYVLFYTLYSDSPFSSIMQVRFDSMAQLINPLPGFMDNNAKNYRQNLVLGPSSAAVRRGPEAGAPPLKTDKGWLLIFCPENNRQHDQWEITAALLDLHDPGKILSVLKHPLLSPLEKMDSGPVCRNCVFPKGALVKGDRLYVYHGTGDNGCALSTCSLKDIMDALTAR